MHYTHKILIAFYCALSFPLYSAAGSMPEEPLSPDSSRKLRLSSVEFTRPEVAPELTLPISPTSALNMPAKKHSLLAQKNQQHYIAQKILGVDLRSCDAHLKKLLLSASALLKQAWQNKEYRKLAKNAFNIAAELYSAALSAPEGSKDKITLLRHAVLLGSEDALVALVETIRKASGLTAPLFNELTQLFLSHTLYCPKKEVADTLDRLFFNNQPFAKLDKDAMRQLCDHNMFGALLYVLRATPSSHKLRLPLMHLLSTPKPQGEWRLAVSPKTRRSFKTLDHRLSPLELKAAIADVLKSL